MGLGLSENEMFREQGSGLRVSENHGRVEFRA